MKVLFFVLFPAALLFGQPTCQVTEPRASLAIPKLEAPAEFNADPHSATWVRAGSATIVSDCTRTIDYPALKTEVRAFWTDREVYFLFACPYSRLNVFLPPQNDRPRNKLWDRDVVEIFLGDDWKNIRHYREFEIAPTGDWIDLAIDLDRKSYNRDWRSGWQTIGRVDEGARVWYAAAKIPLKSVSEAEVKSGTRWRMNLYRIDGEGPDEVRRFLCWQPTCAPGRDPNHVPENFGVLSFR